MTALFERATSAHPSSVPTGTALKRGLACRCPACGQGRLFGRFLKVVETCSECGEPMHHHRADDFPPYIVMFIVGHLVVWGILQAELRYQIPMWVHFSIWPLLTLVLALLLLQPVKGVSELARIGVSEVRERYGVEPEQVPDFIALRGDPSDKIPGAPGVGPKKAADVLKQHGSLEQALADGRFPQDAENLRLYRRIATMDAGAPLPVLGPTPPDWKRAAAFASDHGLGALAGRLESR